MPGRNFQPPFAHETRSRSWKVGPVNIFPSDADRALCCSLSAQMSRAPHLRPPNRARPAGTACRSRRTWGDLEAWRRDAAVPSCRGRKQADVVGLRFGGHISRAWCVDCRRPSQGRGLGVEAVAGGQLGSPSESCSSSSEVYFGGKGHRTQRERIPSTNTS